MKHIYRFRLWQAAKAYPINSLERTWLETVFRQMNLAEENSLPLDAFKQRYGTWAVDLLAILD
jgi:hypothetical protein